MSLKCLGVVLLLGLVAAEIPSYLKICRRRDPNVNQCVIDAVSGCRNKFREGLPELGLPSLDPLYLKFLPLFESNPITVYAYNVVIVGLSDFSIESVHIDFGKKAFNMSSVFKLASFTSEYEIKGKIVLPIEGRGSVRIDGDNINSKIKANYKLVKKDNVEYAQFTSLTTKLTVKNYKAEFKPLNGSVGDAVTTMIKMIIPDGDHEILEAIIPVVEKAISVEVLKNANTIAMLAPFDEYFPDTE